MFSRRKILILFLATSLLSGCYSFRQQLKEMEFKPQPANIASEPVGADVYINDKHVGKTPLTTPLKPLGKEWPDNWKSEIKVTKEGYIPQTRFVHLNEVDQFFELAMTKEYEEKQTRAALSGRGPAPLSLMPDHGEVVIQSQPDNAEIYLDGTYVGDTSSTQLKVTPGVHKIVLKKKGYRDWSKNLYVIKGSSQHLNAELEK